MALLPPHEADLSSLFISGKTFQSSFVCFFKFETNCHFCFCYTSKFLRDRVALCTTDQEQSNYFIGLCKSTAIFLQ